MILIFVEQQYRQILIDWNDERRPKRAKFISRQIVKVVNGRAEFEFAEKVE
jgi:hypothetical protein